MENKLTNIKERILLLAETVEVSKQVFFKKIGITYSNFTGEKKNRPINSDAIKNILINYPQTNPHWLILDEGEMLLKDSQNVSNNGNNNKNIGSNINGNNGNITISHNDMVDLKKELTERLKVCQEHLSESQAQTTTLLEILKNK
ncbi:hypothetical protein [Vaginella massiliensis]|uniref:hypothetical protein n=1 Tax=Vaginella massiliensis TaxID=1816680 RepID=UPI000B9C02FD|nr:hypothetical protein [Vaginella massiliensis]